jgi:hypothetical protein
MAMDPVDMSLTGILPLDLLLDVFRRLSPRQLAASRCLCAAWRAAIDGHRLLRADLLPLSLQGIFLELYDARVREDDENECQDYCTPVLFCRSSLAPNIPADIGYPHNNRCTHGFGCTHGFERSIIDCCNGLVLLLHGRVVNPVTRQWAQLPPMQSPCESAMGLHCWSESKYLVFDPTVSPHYEVFLVSEASYYILPGHVCKGPCEDMLPSTMEWPPTTYFMHVFSSSTGVWEERSFVREGKTIGTVADFKRDSAYKQPSLVGTEPTVPARKGL